MFAQEECGSVQTSEARFSAGFPTPAIGTMGLSRNDNYQRIHAVDLDSQESVLATGPNHRAFGKTEASGIEKDLIRTRDPAWIRVVGFHFPDQLVCVCSEIFLVNPALLINDKSHNS